LLKQAAIFVLTNEELAFGKGNLFLLGFASVVQRFDDFDLLV